MKRALILLVIGAAGLLLASCSSSDSTSADTTPPTVTNWSVTDGTDDLGLITPIDVTFSEDMDPTSIADTTIYVEGRTPRGYVEYDGSSRTARYLPDTLFAAQTWHALVIDGPTDESGNPLARDSVSFQTGTLDCAHLEDHLEPNDAFLEAASVELDREHHTLSICGTDEDFVTFVLTDTRKVTARAAFGHADSTDWSLMFTDDEGRGFWDHGSTAQTGDEATGRHTFLPGTYGLRIRSEDEPVYVLYDLELVTSEPCPDDSFEDNDFTSDASPIEAGSVYHLKGCAFDTDYFSFAAEAGDTITVTVTQTSVDPMGHRVFIYSPTQTSIGMESGYDTEMILEVEADVDGTYMTSVVYWDDGAEYDLLVETE